MDYMAKLRREAKKYGAKIDLGGVRDTSITVDAPRFKVWATTGCHGVYAHSYGRGRQETQWCAEGALKDMEQGLSDCDDPNCDFCYPTDDTDTDGSNA
jgi:hypothetical protein